MHSFKALATRADPNHRPVARDGATVYLLRQKINRKAVMIVIAALVIGALLGWRRATQLGGNRRDRAQYAAAYGLGFAVIGMLATVIIDRMV